MTLNDARRTRLRPDADHHHAWFARMSNSVRIGHLAAGHLADSHDSARALMRLTDDELLQHHLREHDLEPRDTVPVRVPTSASSGQSLPPVHPGISTNPPRFVHGEMVREPAPSEADPLVGPWAEADHLLSLFESAHLPFHLSYVAGSFKMIAKRVHSRQIGQPHPGFETVACLRLLLQAKDCAVRQAVLNHKREEAESADSATPR